jgi:hypothetical protein
MAGEKDDTKGEKDSTKDVAEALKSLLTRIGDIFGVFDLSFFVSGAVCSGALAFGLYIGYGPAPFQAINAKDWGGLHVAAIILLCYVLGLVCFIGGRKAHALFGAGRTPYAGLSGMLRDYELLERYDPENRLLGKREKESRTQQVELHRRAELLYTRLWAEARQSSKLAPSFNLLMRYWVMAAMCDGLSAAFFGWLLVWAYWAIAGADHGLPVSPPSAFIQVVVGLFLGLVVYWCFDEGRRYRKYQLSELLATLAYTHVPRDGETKA